MFGPDEDHVSDASVKTQTRYDVPTPTSESSDGAGLGGKKRKRNGNTMEDLLKDSFTVKPYSSTAFVKPRTLQPLMLLPRSQLPLSSLDITSSAKALAQSRLFEAHVKILELEERMGTEPMLLIARLDDARTLYAVERESRGLYVLCQLGSWVNLPELKAIAIASKQELLPRLSDRGLVPLQLATETASVPLITPESSKYSKKKRLAIEAIQSMVKRPSTASLTESQGLVTEPESGVESQPGEKPSNDLPIPPVDDIAAPPTASEIFENVRNQYFETLYLSKASLAYFAKGPLSRARAAFHLDYDSTLDLNDYIAFLESLVMSTALIDKKYRDGVPNCISLIDVQDHSADEAGHAAAKTKKRRSSKKMKPGKNGLYPMEETLIRRWWSGHDDELDSGAPGSSREELTKTRIAQMRIRETQLQMVLILEVLALQPLASATADIEEGLPTALPTSELLGSKEKLAKSKKPDHLTMLIDVHIDRLCIWQSVALEAVKAPHSDKQSATEKPNGSLTSAKHTDNILRDFCIEVIAPFFSARLPDRCAIINRKLGGPVVVSPPKPKLSKSASFSGAPSRPGAATKRPVPVKPRRSLQRVLTDDRERRSMSRGPNKAISLMRSSTMPPIPGVKREASEAPSLSSIPAADSQSLEANRAGVLKSKRFARREVDLSRLAPEVISKAKKQASIEAELKEAISALKKPNRELAGKSLAETAEKRSASTSHSRKSKKPIRNPLFQGVQISATPKAQRQKDMFAQPQLPDLARTIEKAEWAVIPPSSLPRIPQSVSRPSRDSFPTRNPLLSSVQATPSRKSMSSISQKMDGFLGVGPVNFGGFPPSSPLHVRRSSAQLFTALPDSAGEISASSNGIQETPVKRRPFIGHSHPNVQGLNSDKENQSVESSLQQFPTTHEESIYKSLGWDDADDLNGLV